MLSCFDMVMDTLTYVSTSDIALYFYGCLSVIVSIKMFNRLLMR